MIIVELCGGLGNQMFQYALGRNLAIKNNDELKLNISSFAKDDLRNYELSNLSINASVISEIEAERLKLGFKCRYALFAAKQINRISRKLFGRSLLGSKALIEEKAYTFDPSVLAAKGNVYLCGYWQSEKYFVENREAIFKEFLVSSEPNHHNSEIIKHIISCESVAIHIRRGDYVNDARTSSIYKCCSMDYYQNAVKKIQESVNQPNFFVFSDDSDWAEANIRFANTHVVKGNEGDKSYEDLRLMSLCRHNIIANSSFSWWGAWLNSNPNKKIISPSRWFKKGEFESADRLPDSWIKL